MENLNPEEMEPIESDDDIYTIAQFRSACDAGSFNDYDGSGEWATATMKHRFSFGVYPSDLSNPPAWATHVVWYNK